MYSSRSKLLAGNQWYFATYRLRGDGKVVRRIRVQGNGAEDATKAASDVSFRRAKLHGFYLSAVEEEKYTDPARRTEGLFREDGRAIA